MINKYVKAPSALGGKSLSGINAGLKNKVTPHMGSFNMPDAASLGPVAGMLNGAAGLYEGISNNLNAPDVELMNMQAQNKNDLLSRGNQFASQGGYNNQLGETNVAGSALSMAGQGAAIGSIVPGIGTVIGGVVGGIGGAISSIFGNSKRRRKEREANLKTQREFTGANNLINSNEMSQ